MSCACMGPQNGEPLCPCQMAAAKAFQPNWVLSPTDKMAVKLTIALGKHIPDWPGATDEQLAAVAEEILKPES